MQEVPQGIRLRRGHDRNRRQRHTSYLREGQRLSPVRQADNGGCLPYGAWSEPDDGSHVGDVTDPPGDMKIAFANKRMERGACELAPIIPSNPAHLTNEA